MYAFLITLPYVLLAPISKECNDRGVMLKIRKGKKRRYPIDLNISYTIDVMLYDNERLSVV
jgi:hypothetical protein